MAVIQYSKKVKVDLRSISPAAISAVLFSFLGARTASKLDPALMKPAILGILVVVAVYTFIRKDFGALHAPKLSGSKEIAAGIVIGSAIGFYDGFFGPGTGSFLIFAFIGVFGFDFLAASARAKIVNWGTNFAAVSYFAWTGSVYWKYGILMAACNVLGNWLGARMAILKGNRFVRVFFLGVVAALIARLGWQLYSGK
jgi:uncharacterized membrane protein YfcA